MERKRKYSLFRNVVGAITLAGIAMTGVANAQQSDHEVYFTKRSLSDWFELIPPFFEGCEVLARGWIGRGSVYTEADCIGCNSSLTMANGERLFDNKPTFAAWRDDLNTFYVLRNTENGLRAKGKLTDRGGFDRLANPRPQTIATRELGERTFDLSLALSARLGHIQTSEQTLIDFNKLDCG